MQSWLLVAIITIALAVIIFNWYRSRNLEWQLRLLAVQLDKLTQCKQRDVSGEFKWLRRIYILLNRCISSRDQVNACQALDLLKLAYGQGVLRKDEPVHLIGIISASLRVEEADVAALALDVSRVMLRRLPLDVVPTAIEQLATIGIVALREKKNYLADKITEYIFLILEQPQYTADTNITASALRMLKVLGVLALKRRDTALFREIGVRLAAWIGSVKPGDFSEALSLIITAWLFQVVRTQDEDMFAVLADLAVSVDEAQMLTAEAVELLVNEWSEIAGIACLNPHNPLPQRIVTHMLNMTAARKELRLWKLAVDGAGKIAKITVTRNDLDKAFPVLFPLLETGRTLLLDEMRFGSVESDDVFRQKAVYILVKECMVVLEFVVRKNVTNTVGDVIMDIFRLWTAYPAAQYSHKSVKKFCQLLLIYWKKTKPRQAGKVLLSGNDLTEPELLSSDEKARLTFLG